MNSTVLQFRPNQIIEYTPPRPGSNINRSIQANLTANLLKQDTYTGVLCTGAKKRLTKAVNVLIELAPSTYIFNPVTNSHHPFTLNFITLTVYSPYRMITGAEAYKTCLAPFLRWFRDKQGLKSYVWKAELQQRGQVHYHLTTDTFIHKDVLQAKWNELQQKAGYLNEFFDTYGRWDAPSTHVKAVKDVADMAQYIKKMVANFDKKARVPGRVDAIFEMTKTLQNLETVGGKVWDCSLNLKRAIYFSVPCDEQYYRALNKAVAENKMVRIPTEAHCNIYKQVFNKHVSDQPIEVFDFKSLLGFEDRYRYRQHINAIREGFRFKNVDTDMSRHLMQPVYKFVPKQVEVLDKMVLRAQFYEVYSAADKDKRKEMRLDYPHYFKKKFDNTK